MTHQPMFEVRPSAIHGSGAFSARRIRKGTRIIEYTGERISSEEGDRRYEEDPAAHPLVLLFVVDKHTVIDAAVGGNEARFINHSCEPNCEAVTERRRVFIQALKDIAAGEELTYDYNLTRDGQDDAEIEQRYACHCGARSCRGTMLAPPKSQSGRAK